MREASVLTSEPLGMSALACEDWILLDREGDLQQCIVECIEGAVRHIGNCWQATAAKPAPNIVPMQRSFGLSWRSRERNHVHWAMQGLLKHCPGQRTGEVTPVSPNGVNDNTEEQELRVISRCSIGAELDGNGVMACFSTVEEMIASH